MNQMLKQLDDLEDKCKELFQRELTSEEAKIMGYAFEKGRQFAILAIAKDIQKHM